jgi:hypothetical protein
MRRQRFTETKIMSTKGRIVNFEGGRLICLDINLPLLCKLKIQIDNSILNIHHHDDIENNDILGHSNSNGLSRHGS